MFTHLTSIPMPAGSDCGIVPLNVAADNFAYPTARHVFITASTVGSSRVIFTTGSVFEKLYDVAHDDFSKPFARICRGVGDREDVLLKKFSWDISAHAPQAPSKEDTKIHYFVDEDFENLKKIDSSLFPSDAEQIDEPLYLPTMDMYNRTTSLLAQIDALVANQANAQIVHDTQMAELKAKLLVHATSEATLFKQLDDLRVREAQWSEQRMAFLKRIELCERELARNDSSSSGQPIPSTSTTVSTPVSSNNNSSTDTIISDDTLQPADASSSSSTEDFINSGDSYEKRVKDRRALEQRFARDSPLTEDDMQVLDTVYGKDTRPASTTTSTASGQSERELIEKERTRLAVEKAEVYNRMRDAFELSQAAPTTSREMSPILEETPLVPTETKPEKPNTTKPKTKPETNPNTTKPKTSAPETKPKTSAPETKPKTSAPETKPKTSAPETKPKTSVPAEELGNKPKTNTTIRKKPRKLTFDADVAKLGDNVVFRPLTNARASRARAIFIPSISLRAKRLIQNDSSRSAISARVVFTLDASLCAQWSAEDFDQFSLLLNQNSMVIIIGFTPLTTQTVIQSFERILLVRQNPFVKFPPSLAKLYGCFNMSKPDMIACHGMTLERALDESAKIERNQMWIDSSFKQTPIDHTKKFYYAFTATNNTLDYTTASTWFRNSASQSASGDVVVDEAAKDLEALEFEFEPAPAKPLEIIGFSAPAFGVFTEGDDRRCDAICGEPTKFHKILRELFLNYRALNSYVRTVTLSVDLNNSLRNQGIQVYHFFFRNRLHQVVVDGFIYLHPSVVASHSVLAVDYAFFCKALDKLMEFYRCDLRRCSPIDIARFMIGDQIFNIARHEYISSQHYFKTFDWDTHAVALTNTHYLWSSQQHKREYYIDNQSGDILQRIEGSTAGLNLSALLNSREQLSVYYSAPELKYEQFDPDSKLELGYISSVIDTTKLDHIAIPILSEMGTILYDSVLNLTRLRSGLIGNIPEALLAAPTWRRLSIKHARIFFDLNYWAPPCEIDEKHIKRQQNEKVLADFSNTLATYSSSFGTEKTNVCLGATGVMPAISDALDINGKCTAQSFSDNILIVAKHSYFRDSTVLLQINATERSFSLEIDRQSSDVIYYPLRKLQSITLQTFLKDSVLCRIITIDPPIRRDQDLALWFQVPQLVDEESNKDARFVLHVMRFKQRFTDIPHMASNLDVDVVFQQEYCLGYHLTATCRFKITGDKACYMFALKSTDLRFVGKSAFFRILN